MESKASGVGPGEAGGQGKGRLGRSSFQAAWQGEPEGSGCWSREALETLLRGPGSEAAQAEEGVEGPSEN